MTESRLPPLFAVAAVALALLAVGGPAQAHDTVVSSTPAADSILTELPAAFEIVTSDPLLDVGGQTGAFALQVLDAQGRYYGDGCVDIDDATMTTVAALGQPGSYTVRWQFVAADGHTVSGEYGFSWAPSASDAPSISSAAPPVCGVAAPSPSPSESAAPPASPAPSTSPETATPAPPSEPSTQTETLPVVLGIGGGVIGIAAIIIAAVLLTGRKRDTR